MIPTRVSARTLQRVETHDGRRTLGILGGMGPLATARFYERLVLRTDAKRDQDHLTVYMSANPSIPDRTKHIDGVGPDPVPALIEEAMKLVSMGVDLIVMPCNSAHVFHSELQEAVPVPVLDWVGVTVDEVVRLGFKTVGVAATRGTLSSGVYQQSLDRAGVDVVVPSEDQIESIMELVYGSEGVKTVGRATKSSIVSLQNVLSDLKVEGADCVLLACTELPIVTDDPAWQGTDSLIDPGEIAITRCLEVLSVRKPRSTQ